MSTTVVSVVDDKLNNNDHDNRNKKEDNDEKGDDKEPTILLDSLPYLESVHEDYEEYALALIEEEMKRITPPKQSLMNNGLPPLNVRTSLILQNEYQALKIVVPTTGDLTGEQQQSAVVVHSQRPPSQDDHNHNNNHNMFQPVKIVPPTSVEEWPITLAQMKSRYEMERLRSLSLEVELQETVSNWKTYNTFYLDQLKEYWKHVFQQRKDAIEEINFQRQQIQTQHIGPEMDRLLQEYQQTVYRRNQLEYAIYQAEKQIGPTP